MSSVFATTTAVQFDLEYVMELDETHG
uniref:Uncharacterized protein n=1 Tax=Moniliophthora roreri TaxID=221103 RepID=A0A0W0FX33_MONRR